MPVWALPCRLQSGRSVLASRHLSRCLSTRPTGVPLPVYEAVSSSGPSPLRGHRGHRGGQATAPWARKNATSTTGGGGFVVATLCAGVVAAVLLWMCDQSMHVVALLRFPVARFTALAALGRTSTSTASLKAHDACAAAAESVTPTRNELPGTPQADAWLRTWLREASVSCHFRIWRNRRLLRG